MNLDEPERALEILKELARLREWNVDTQGLETTRANIAACRMRTGDLAGASFDTTGDDLKNIAGARHSAAGDLRPDDPRAVRLGAHVRRRVPKLIDTMGQASEVARALGDGAVAAEADAWLEEVNRILAARAPDG